jgi:hypothetical protein
MTTLLPIPPPVANASVNALLLTLNAAQKNLGESIEDLEARAGLAAKRAKTAMTVHQTDHEAVTTREVGQQQVFAVEASLAVVLAKVGIPPADGGSPLDLSTIAALSQVSTRLDAMEERVNVLNNTMDEQVKIMKNQLITVMARQTNAIATEYDDPIHPVLGPGGQTPPDEIFPNTYGKLMMLDDKTSKDLLLFYERPTDPEEVNNIFLRKFLGAH